MLYLTTNTDTYYVNESDQIYRPNIVAYRPSPSWLLKGAVEMRMVFGRYIRVRTFSIQDIRDKKVPWLFKNGKPRCFVWDFDHGINRIWYQAIERSGSFQ
jgi:hypothetical protein